MSAPRGQAVTELALASLVLVGVLMAGIHFSEHTFLSMKVHEAATAALWDSTHGKVHRMGARYDVDPAHTTVANATIDANGRYEDFDGRSSARRAPSLTQVFTSGTQLTVGCGVGAGPLFGPNLYAATAYRDNGGVSCQAAAQLQTLRLPAHFADRAGGFFREPHWSRARTQVCGFGRAWQGGCGGGVAMLLDDWGLAEGAEGTSCPGLPYGLPCPSNAPYWLAAAKVYAVSSTLSGVAFDRSATELAEAVVGVNPQAPFDERMFQLSFTGEETAFQQVVYWPLVAEGAMSFETTPFLMSAPTYFAAWRARSGNGGCYLGQSCNAP